MISRIVQEFFSEQSFETKNPEHESLRKKVEKMLSSGPKPYGEILEAVGGDEDALRTVIRGWDELAAFTDRDGVFMWELVKDPVILAERIGLRFETEIPDEKALGKPVFTYRGHILARESDPAHIRVYAWATCHLLPGRPLDVDPEPVARLLGLSAHEVKEAIKKLVLDGDLVVTRERGRELYKLVVNY